MIKQISISLGASGIAFLMSDSLDQSLATSLASAASIMVASASLQALLSPWSQQCAAKKCIDTPLNLETVQQWQKSLDSLSIDALKIEKPVNADELSSELLKLKKTSQLQGRSDISPVIDSTISSWYDPVEMRSMALDRCRHIHQAIASKNVDDHEIVQNIELCTYWLNLYSQTGAGLDANALAAAEYVKNQANWIIQHRVLDSTSTTELEDVCRSLHSLEKQHKPTCHQVFHSARPSL